MLFHLFVLAAPLYAAICTSDFKLDESNWWTCSDNAISCYNTVAQRVMDSVSVCPTTCLSMNSAQFGSALSKTLGKATVDCTGGVWTPELDYAANIVLQKAAKCEIDHKALLVMFEAVSPDSSVRGETSVDASIAELLGGAKSTSFTTPVAVPVARAIPASNLLTQVSQSIGLLKTAITGSNWGAQ
ncbi:MAG: hypothetical protein JW384_01652 [Nitrosomonadaceae bacterium]|nr:hypothetical protein [Nitrosomonadaceae bacterium]